ncbi:MAG TPA: hypothetical protein VGK51_06825, partial [Actinomycetota bacterium]
MTASNPPGRTARQSSRMAATMSSTKKMPNTQTTASNEASWTSRSVMSPRRKVTVESPCSLALALPSSSSRSARSTPRTEPASPAACAAGSADEPAPQQTSSTRSPGRIPASSTVRRPHRSQNDRAESSKLSAAALKAACVRCFRTSGSIRTATV